MTKAQEFSVKVQSEDPKKKDKPENDKATTNGVSKPIKETKGEEGEELVRWTYRAAHITPINVSHFQSEEDQQLKEQLEMLVERLKVRLMIGRKCTADAIL